MRRDIRAGTAHEDKNNSGAGKAIGTSHLVTASSSQCKYFSDP